MKNTVTVVLLSKNNTHPESHSLYWKDRQRAFKLIRTYDQLQNDLQNEPMYINGGWDVENDEPIILENLEPYDKVDDFRKVILQNETVVKILTAQSRLTSQHQII